VTSKTTNDGHHLQQADTTPTQDIDIVGKSLEAVRDAYLALEMPTLHYMIAAGNKTILDAGQTVTFGEVVNENVYLGALVTSTNDVGLKIQRRI
jgi:hypothetical protein